MAGFLLSNFLKCLREMGFSYAEGGYHYCHSFYMRPAKPLSDLPDSPIKVDRFLGEPPNYRDMEMLLLARIPHFKLPPILSASEGDSCNLPRVVYVTFGRNGKTVSSILLDTGSGYTYISVNVLLPLGCLKSFNIDCDLKLLTLLGVCKSRIKEVSLKTDINARLFPVLVDETFGSGIPFRLTLLYSI